MGIKSTISLFSSMFVLLNMFSSQHCTVINSITPSQPLTHGQTLISPSQFLELGFFVPSNSSTNQYIGIWYKNIYPRKVVWVANREKPLAVTDSMAVLTIGRNGNLNLLDGNQNTVWSTNISVRANNSSLAVLLDIGNLILKDGVTGEALWEGFDYPCDTMLPTMLNGMNSKTGEKHFYTAWKSEDDPSPGKFVVGLLALVPPQTFIWNGSSPYWRSGQWDKSTFIGIPEMAVSYVNGYNLEQDMDQGTAYFSISIFRDLYAGHLVITPSGSFQILYWDQDKKEWQLDWEAPRTLCDVYAVCGPYGVCKMNEKSPTCKCLEGFVPKSDEDWKKGIWRGGCVRRTELLCQTNNSNLTTQERKEDGFVKISKMKLPDISEWQLASNQECQIWCSNNCSCIAYAFVNGIGCMIWATDLIDLQEFSFNGEDIFIRLAHSELGREEKKREKFIINFTVVSVISVIFGAIVFGWWWRKSNLVKQRKNQSKLSSELLKAQLKQEDSSELIMFDIDSIVAATNDFSVTNKLGEGGFGPVYKGKLKDGKKVAVKRLSSSSAQGLEEFRNEILLISKLQHRNLVRLLGCCIDGEEKLLVYEHMSNKSLDTFIFDSTKKKQLGWVERFNIIQGIARGLLYLHRDSSLRIIHRDLKTSNILLDEDMNPKISDFGLARPFLKTQDLENTRRVVGTFGYMSPEYAMRGIFSERSDVFSFGVLLLEIVSGQKNTSFHFDKGQHINFLSYAWKLWNESRGLDVMDQVMRDSFSAVEVMRCIHVGLLCVQDHALDRHTMSAVVFMLSNETDRPQPKEPTFTFQRSSDHDQNLCSTNEVTVSLIKGR